jgi:hypothetical protein
MPRQSMSRPLRLEAGYPAPVPVREILPWLVFAAALMLFLIYLVGAEGGATALFPGRYVHELMHDGRHLLAFPCH